MDGLKEIAELSEKTEAAMSEMFKAYVEFWIRVGNLLYAGRYEDEEGKETSLWW